MKRKIKKIKIGRYDLSFLFLILLRTLPPVKREEYWAQILETARKSLTKNHFFMIIDLFYIASVPSGLGTSAGGDSRISML